MHTHPGAVTVDVLTNGLAQTMNAMPEEELHHAFSHGPHCDLAKPAPLIAIKFHRHQIPLTFHTSGNIVRLNQWADLTGFRSSHSRVGL